jgi:hypothetical protein
MMNNPSRLLRWLQIILTLFYGQMISTGIHQYIIQGIAGLLTNRRLTFDCVLLLVIGLLMVTFVFYAVAALWYQQNRLSMITCSILIFILILTALKSIMEILAMSEYALRTEWIAIRITELIIRVLGILGSVIFIVRLRQGYEPDEF